MEEGSLGTGGFGRGGRRAAALGFALAFVLSAVLVAWHSGRASAGAVEQPITFNHKKHVKEHDLACSACHQFFEKEAFSGLPSAEVCSMCHAEPQGKSPEEAKLVRLLQAGSALEWKPLFRQPPHVFYSHRRHVVAAKTECTVCHGSIGESEKPPSQVKRLRMDDCLSCHQKTGAPTDCTACHR